MTVKGFLADILSFGTKIELTDIFISRGTEACGVSRTPQASVLKLRLNGNNGKWPNPNSPAP